VEGLEEALLISKEIKKGWGKLTSKEKVCGIRNPQKGGEKR